jgi:glycosyltransferase involved in cell wall biosynthesis
LPKGSGDLLQLTNRLLILIPAFNEAGNIAQTVKEVLTECVSAEVLVVDDGSADDTAKEAAKSGARVLRLPVNLGIGGAVQAGFLFALRSGYTQVVRLDADGQHGAQDIPTILKGLREGADLVVGSRFLSPDGFKGLPLRKLGIRFIARLCRLLNNGLVIGDPTSGFRGYSHIVLKLFAQRYPVDYPEPEELIMASNAHFRIIEVPVTMAPRRQGQSSIGGWISIFYILKVVLAAFIEKSRGRNAPG